MIRSNQYGSIHESTSKQCTNGIYNSPWSNDGFQNRSCISQSAQVKNLYIHQAKSVNAQNSDNLLSIVPAHFLHELDARNEVASAAGAQEQTVALNEETRHGDRFRVRYSSTHHVSMPIRV